MKIRVYSWLLFTLFVGIACVFFGLMFLIDSVGDDDNLKALSVTIFGFTAIIFLIVGSLASTEAEVSHLTRILKKHNLWQDELIKKSELS